MILYVENPKESTKKNRTKKSVNKVAEYIVFLCTSNEQSKNKITKQFHLQSHHRIK